MTTIYYTVPADGDDQAHPNVYKIPNTSAKELTLAKIAQTFPLPGNYHFRFKYDYRNTYVWLDVTSALSKVPLFKGNVYIKAARLNRKNSTSKTVSFEATKPSKPRPTRPPAPSLADPTSNKDNGKVRLKHRQSSEELLNLDRENSGNLLDVESSPELKPSSKPRTTSEEDLLNIWHDDSIAEDNTNKSSTNDDDPHDLASLF